MGGGEGEHYPRSRGGGGGGGRGGTLPLFPGGGGRGGALPSFPGERENITLVPEGEGEHYPRSRGGERGSITLVPRGEGEHYPRSRGGGEGEHYPRTQRRGEHYPRSQVLKHKQESPACISTVHTCKIHILQEKFSKCIHEQSQVTRQGVHVGKTEEVTYYVYSERSCLSTTLRV